MPESTIHRDGAKAVAVAMLRLAYLDLLSDAELEATLRKVKEIDDKREKMWANGQRPPKVWVHQRQALMKAYYENEDARKFFDDGQYKLYADILGVRYKDVYDTYIDKLEEEA